MKAFTLMAITANKNLMTTVIANILYNTVAGSYIVGLVFDLAAIKDYIHSFFLQLCVINCIVKLLSHG